MRPTQVFVVGAVLGCSLVGCSEHALKRAGYESLHTISDFRNEDDPKYDPAQRPSFETYQQQREDILREQRPEQQAPLVPAPPPKP